MGVRIRTRNLIAVPRDREDRGELRTGTPGAGVCLLDDRVPRWKDPSGLSSACSDCRIMSPAANTTRDQASLWFRGMSQQSLEVIITKSQSSRRFILMTSS